LILAIQILVLNKHKQKHLMICLVLIQNLKMLLQINHQTSLISISMLNNSNQRIKAKISFQWILNHNNNKNKANLQLVLISILMLLQLLQILKQRLSTLIHTNNNPKKLVLKKMYSIF
jgi:hypothetical protein